MKKSSKKFKTGLSNLALNNRLKAFAFAVFFVMANLLSLSSTVLVQSAQARDPQPNKTNNSPPNLGSIPPEAPVLINNLQDFNNANGQLASLVEQVAEQEEQSDINIDNNLNTGLITAPNSTSSAAAASSVTPTSYYPPTELSQIWQAVVGYTGQFLNTSPNTGKTTGLAGQVFEGMQAIFYYTIGGGWIPKLGWIFAQYTQDFVSEWIGPTIGNFLIARLIAFKDNPDVSYQTDSFSIQMRSLNHIVRDFSYDLLLLFFILGIWRYWTNSVWGNGNLWGAVGRIVTATATVIAWPEIYHYTILIANLANDLFIQNLPPPDQLGADVVTFFYNVVAFPATEKTGLMIPFDWILELVINLAIGLAMLVSLIVFFVEKAIQLTIVVMAYVFGPFFIICIASPDTERYVSDFLKVFVEACAWNFIWGGLISILMYTIEEGMKPDSPIYMLTSNATLPVTSNPNNPWFVLLLMLGIMQAMLQVPGYISRGTLSAKPGILELGFAAYQAKRILAGLYGTHGLYTQLRHAIRDPNTHRWPLNLPQVKPADYAALQGKVGEGSAFGQKAFAGLATGSALSPALAGASGGSLSSSSALTSTQAAALTSGKNLGLTPQPNAAQAAAAQAQAAAAAQAQALQLDKSQSDALAKGQLFALNRDQIKALTPTQASTLAAAQRVALGQASNVPLSEPQSNILSKGGVLALRQEQLAALTPDQNAVLLAAQNAALAAAPTGVTATSTATRAALPTAGLGQTSVPLPVQAAIRTNVSSQAKIPTRAGLPLEGPQRVTGKQTHTNLAAWLAQKVRLEGGVTFHELDKHPGVGFSKTGITFDQIGGPDSFSVPKGASKEQRALAMAATSFANNRDDHGKLDPGFEDAMLMANMHRSMRRGGPLNPWNGTNMLGGVNQKWMDRIALWLSDGKADDAWKTSMKVRTNRMQNKVIVEGVNAYMHGKSDGKNGIADYWEDKRGDFDPALQVYRLTDPSAKAGGVNQNALEVRSILARANIELNGTTQTAAAHPLILALPSTEKPVAVHAMIRLLQSSAVSEYGETATKMNRPQLQTFYDGVMKHVGEDHVQAAAAIARNYGLNYVNPVNVNKVVGTQREMYNDSLNKDDFSRSAQAAFGRLPPTPDATYTNQVGRLLW